MTKQSPQKLLLLDVSNLVFRAYFALPPLTTASGHPAGALYGFLSMLLKSIQERKPTHIAAAIDVPGKTFRDDIYPEYKATRDETPEDLKSQFPMVLEALEALGIPILGAEGFEADDAIATATKKAQKSKAEVVIEIESGDKDLYQLVEKNVVVLAPKGQTTSVSEVTAAEVEKRLGVSPKRVIEYKALCGDPSDNIKGVEGVGPKAAAQLLEIADSLEDLIRLAEKGRVSELPGFGAKKEEKILASAKSMLRDRTVVTLRYDAPISFTLKASKIEHFPKPAFVALLKRWGFETLLKRFAESAGKSENATQGSLALGGETFEEFIVSQEKQVHEEIDRREAGGEFSKEVAELERAIVPTISAMERRGILVDKEQLEKLKKRFSKQQQELQKRITGAVGKTFNLASPKQLAEVLYDDLGIHSTKKTKGGQRSTAAAVLEELADEHDIVKDILSWREVTKLLTTYIEAFPELVEEDGCIHAKFWQLGAATGRIASSDPNLQNIPTRTEDGRAVRNAFVAKKGSTLLSADYSQIELRVAAVLAEEEAMLQAFKGGLDIHSVTAQRVFHVDADGVTKEMRRQAKILNFGILYGMGPRAVSKQMGVSFKEGKSFRDNYLRAFGGLEAWMKKTVTDAEQRGFTETAFGRKRFFEEFSSGHPALKARAQRAAMNAPVQGTAADLVKKGMVALASQRNTPPVLVQVHDELLLEVLTDELADAARVVREALEGVWPAAPVAFPVTLRAGERWGSLEPL